MKTLIVLTAGLCCVVLLSLHLPSPPEDWGFYGHRLINRKAVFTLPREMIPFFKQHIDFLSDHAVDPDKRRYATKHEAVRHYIDLDEWGSYPFSNLPRSRTEALSRHCRVMLVSADDTLSLIDSTLPFSTTDTIRVSIPQLGADSAILAFEEFRRFFVAHFLRQYYEEVWTAPADSLLPTIKGCQLPDSLPDWQVLGFDSFSEHGILPYHLILMQNRLTEAFLQKDPDVILRLAADFGHYIGDAHVPLHTTSNYNGQKSGQVGIHAFWESRLPELFAEEDYDFLVGQAQYIKDPHKWYWSMVLESHLLVDSTLAIEQRLRDQVPAEQQYCYDERLGRVVRTQCRDYAEAYHRELNGQVERRMTQAVKAIGSAWYTAWVDAGQPVLRSPQSGIQKPANITAGDAAIPEQPKEKATATRTHEQ